MTSTDQHLAPLRNATPGPAFHRWATGLTRLQGRAGRWEYWTINLAFVVASFVIDEASRGTSGGTRTALAVAVATVTCLAMWAVTVRRLHDMGQTGWWYTLQVVLAAAVVTRRFHPAGWPALDKILVVASLGTFVILVMTLIGPREAGKKYGPPS